MHPASRAQVSNFCVTKQKDVISFTYQIRSSGGNRLGQDRIPVQAAIEVFNILGRSEEARRLSEWVVMSQDNKGDASQLPDLNQRFTIELVGERYKDDPLDQVGCETKAARRGETYTPPTSEQFLKTAAKSLAKFEMPYQRELFLAKPKDLRVLQHEHSRPEQRQAMIQNLQNSFSEETKISDVSLREVSRDELPDNVVVPTKHAWKPDFFLELRIEDQTRYLDYRDYTFQVLDSLKQKIQ